MRDPLHPSSLPVQAFLLSVALLAVACGSGDPMATSSSPRPTATPESITLEGGEGATPEAAPTSAGGDEPAQDEAGAGDPAAAVDAFLEAVSDGDQEAQLAGTDGPARALMRIRDVIRQHNARGDAETEERVEVAEGPETTELSPDRATVALRSVVESFVRTPEETIRSEARIDGPVALERRGDRWVVTDFVYSGRPLGPRYVVVGESQEQEGIRLEVGLLLSYKRTTAVILRLVNTAEEGRVDVSISEAVLEGPDGGRAEPEQLAVGSGRAPEVFIGFPRTEDRPRALEATLERSGGGGSRTYRVELA